TVEAPVVVCMDLPVRIAPQDDVSSQPMQADGWFLHAGGLTDRIPHVPQAEFQLSFEFDLFIGTHKAYAERINCRRVSVRATPLLEKRGGRDIKEISRSHL